MIWSVVAEMSFPSLEAVRLDGSSNSVFEILLFWLDIFLRRLNIMTSQLFKYLLVAVGVFPCVLSSAPILQPTPPMGYNNVGHV